MRIRLRLFASLQKWLPDNPIDHEVAGPKTIREFMSEKGIPEEAVAICICNGDKVSADKPLCDGDSLEIFPLIGGG